MSWSWERQSVKNRIGRLLIEQEATESNKRKREIDISLKRWFERLHQIEERENERG